MLHRERILLGVVGVLSIGLLFAGAGLVTLYTKQAANRDAITQLVQSVKQAQADAAAARVDASSQRRLVQALQRQVRRLGGQPLTEPPTTPSPAGTGADARASSSPRPTSRSSTQPQRPTPGTSPTPSRPPPSSTPSPSPSPTCIVRPLCLLMGVPHA